MAYQDYDEYMGLTELEMEERERESMGQQWDEDKEEWVEIPCTVVDPPRQPIPVCIYDPCLTDDERVREMMSLSDDERAMIRAISSAVVASHDFNGGAR